MTGVDITKADHLMTLWDEHYQKVNPWCEASDRCVLVRYEQLVLRPRETMTKLLGEKTFLCVAVAVIIC